MKTGRIAAVMLGTLTFLGTSVNIPQAAYATTSTYWCIQPVSPWKMYRERKLPLPHKCAAGYMLARTVAGVNEQLITVGAKSYNTSYAKLTAFNWTGTRWARVYGAYTARIGYYGMAKPGAYIEGHALTPQGSYGFEFFFGVYANPGVSFPYRHAYRYDVWDDDSNSTLYNEWVDERYNYPGVNPEPLHNVPSYDYAAVIAYNTARIPGKGSAIFLHVGDGSATAGCVSLPTAELLNILLWMRPARHPVIAMKVVSS